MTNEQLLDDYELAVQAQVKGAGPQHTASARAAVLARMVGWQPLCAVSDCKALGEVMLRAFYPDRNTASDVYHGWYSRGDWVRWPHAFLPTHYMSIPPLPAAAPVSP